MKTILIILLHNKSIHKKEERSIYNLTTKK